MVVNWGDGSTPTSFDLTGGVTSFSGLAHTYLAQPSYNAGTSDTITVSVTDPYQPLAPATAPPASWSSPRHASSLTVMTDVST